MRQTVLNAWDLLETAYNTKIKDQNSDIIFDKNLFDDCYDYFKQWRELIQKKYMKDPEKELDRHKIAAILTISIIQSKSIYYNNKISNNQIFIGLQLLAVTCGLSYMQDELNKILIENGYDPIDKYDLPIPFSCDTNYLEVIARNLYYQEHGTDLSGKKVWTFNPLDLANEYFLIEYITLIKRGIPTDTFLLKDKQK